MSSPHPRSGPPGLGDTTAPTRGASTFTHGFCPSTTDPYGSWDPGASSSLVVPTPVTPRVGCMGGCAPPPRCTPAPPQAGHS